MLNLVIFLTLMFAGYYYGGHRERTHIQSIQRREKLYLNLPHKNFGKKEVFEGGQTGQVFYGSVVVGQDYFKSFLFGLRNLFGGEATAYVTLLDRARREALLRLKRRAKEWGAEQIVNLRYETSTVTSNKGNEKNGSIEVLVYGTGIKG